MLKKKKMKQTVEARKTFKSSFHCIAQYTAHRLTPCVWSNYSDRSRSIQRYAYLQVKESSPISRVSYHAVVGLCTTSAPIGLQGVSVTEEVCRLGDVERTSSNKLVKNGYTLSTRLSRSGGKIKLKYNLNLQSSTTCGNSKSPSGSNQPEQTFITRQLFNENAHLGHQLWNYGTSSFIVGRKNNTSIINLEETKVALKRSLKVVNYLFKTKKKETRKLVPAQQGSIKPRKVGNTEGWSVTQKYTFDLTKSMENTSQLQQKVTGARFIKETSNQGSYHEVVGHILFFNTNPEYNKIVRLAAKLTDQSYLNNKWLGGLLTNWKEINLSLGLFQKFEDLYKSFLIRKNISFSRYKKMKKSFEGISPLKKRPNLIIFLNPNQNEIPIREAFNLNIPIIALVDSNTPPRLLSQITYPIPGAQTSLPFIYFFLNLVVKTIQSSNFNKVI
uniref:Ribosomal protein S2 n=1 Tax=Chlorokybus atmophyticus TaxID=3144 RepID=A6YEB6_CHLAT|nr:ribosomal protein S2 [Chlorokybus atmophyticus]ABO15120.1 ribosomal protein S2 [Chlorokybus atmophyticus]